MKLKKFVYGRGVTLVLSWLILKLNEHLNCKHIDHEK